jgi:hypothetical protein
LELDMTLVAKRTANVLRRLSPVLREEKELSGHMREYIVPNPPAQADKVPNVPVSRLDVPGIDFREQAQLALLESFRTAHHAELFSVLRNDPVINRSALGEAAVSNTFCNTPDAEIYASMILARRPSTLVEVGSGFSTLIAKKTIEFLRYGTRISVFDPYPRTDVRAVADELQLAPVEQSDLLGRRWAENDILFIDSSHICRTRGDLPFLFCQLIPSLPAGVLVHVHDIFLPYDYPNLYDQWCHTEEYLLACTLAHSTRYRVVMATHWLSREHPKRMNEVFGPYAGTDKSAPHHLGCSFWFEVVR